MAQLRCPSCGSEAPATSQRFECACGDLFDVHHAFRRVDRELFDERLGRSGSPLDGGVWRFRELVYPRFPWQGIVSLQEGDTPLHAARDVSAWAGVEDLVLKHEGRNPTGSSKDRGMTVAVSRAAASRARWLACASTGNTGASLAAYASAAGLRSLVVVPEGATARGKLGQALAHGANVVQVRGDFDCGLALVRELAGEEEVVLLNSVNPFRLEGQKSIVLELLQQLDWRVPDWIAFPAGNLGNCAAFGKALREARQVGLIRDLPRLLAVQAAGANPFACAYRDDFRALEPLEASTLAGAIRIGAPASYARAVRSILETDGVVTDVPDGEILEAKAVMNGAGIGAEPASGAALAGVRRLVGEGTIQPWDRVVCVLTGHLLEDPETAPAHHAGELEGIRSGRANAPVTIGPSLAELRDVLNGAKC